MVIDCKLHTRMWDVLIKGLLRVIKGKAEHIRVINIAFDTMTLDVCGEHDLRREATENR